MLTIEPLNVAAREVNNPFRHSTNCSVGTAHSYPKTVGDRTIRLPVCHTPKEQQYLFLLAKLLAALMNCQLEFAQCASILVSITGTFPSSYGNGSQTPLTNTLGWLLQSNYLLKLFTIYLKQATAARSIMSSLLSGMVQLVISHSSCSKAAKIFKKSAIFKHNKWSPSMPCVAGHVTTNPGKRSDAFHSTSENSGNLNR